MRISLIFNPTVYTFSGLQNKPESNYNVTFSALPIKTDNHHGKQLHISIGFNRWKTLIVYVNCAVHLMHDLIGNNYCKSGENLSRQLRGMNNGTHLFADAMTPTTKATLNFFNLANKGKNMLNRLLTIGFFALTFVVRGLMISYAVTENTEIFDAKELIRSLDSQQRPICDSLPAGLRDILPEKSKMLRSPGDDTVDFTSENECCMPLRPLKLLCTLEAD